MTVVGKKLKALGFKKIPGTEPGFHMYELNPAELGSRQRIHDNLKAEAASAAPNAKRASTQANKRTSSQANKLDK
jgi:hypothetical protein